MQVSYGSSTAERLARIDATTRAVTCRYVLGLGLIGALALGGFLTLQRTIAANAASSPIINLSAHQGILVQHAMTSARLLVESADRSARPSERGELFETVHALEQAHRLLTDPSNPLGRPVGKSGAVRAIYFAEPLNLDQEIRSFIAQAIALIRAREEDLAPDHPSFRRLANAAHSVLPLSIDALVRQLEMDARASVRRSQTLQTALLVITLLMLCLQALLIFGPIVRRVDSEARKLVESQDQLVELAHYDPLTGLPNRTLFHSRLQTALAQARRDNGFAAVLQLDLDHFKGVNDTLGHAAGDHLLSTVACRLQTAVREIDTVARLGGDEFVIILSDLRSGEDAARVAEKVIALVREPIVYLDHTLHISTSIGITVYPDDDEEPDQLLKNADIALYRAKAMGRGTYSFYVGEMKARIARHRQLETELRRALGGDQIEVFYQPQVRVDDGGIASAEALVHWRHPDLGLLMPDRFIDLAEDSGLIVPLGALVLERTLGQMRSWSDQGIAPARIAVNLSTGQFGRGCMLSTVGQALSNHGISPQQLELEIPEGVILSRSRNEIMAALERLHGLGVTFSLDAFGTGYASLTHLNRFPFHRLKIDRSFVRDIEHDPCDALIVRTVINLCRSLGYEAIAEGIESQEQLTYLRLHGCQLAQGDLFSAPLSAAAMTELLRGGARVELPGRPGPLRITSQAPAPTLGLPAPA